MSIDADDEKSTGVATPLKEERLERDIPSNHKYRQSIFATMLLSWISISLTFSGFMFIDQKLTTATTADLIVVALEIIFGVFCGLYAIKIVLATSESAKVVIPKEDRNILEDIIRSGDEKGMDQYIRLSSLSGITGTFTKLGLTGLPLATIGLTLFFSIVSLYQEHFLDLAKLTLGAFIGSFVQRSVSTEKFTGDASKNSNTK